MKALERKNRTNKKHRNSFTDLPVNIESANSNEEIQILQRKLKKKD